MQSHFIEYIYLILIILGLVMIANKLKVAYPIILVLGGLVLSFTSVFSNVSIDPELVFFIFLPPLLYEAAWSTSWKEFYKWRRVIMSFAFPIVIITSVVIAFVSNALIPGFTLALGFLLGGIISPPDAISATTIMRQVKVPKSLSNIIEGESLLNDASSLIVFRFAVAAIITGQFDLGQASITFFMVVVMGTLIGLAIGLIFYGIHRLLHTTSSIEVILTLVTPYCMYYFAEYFHYSGVLAVVSGGLFLSSKRQTMLSYRSRIEGVNVWTNIVFVLNGLIFLLIGLQLPIISKDLGMELSTAIWYGVIISFSLIVSRFLCAFGAVIFTKFMSHFIKVQDANPGWKTPLIAGWAGMRGVVSLAAALSIPLLGSNGQPFPYRNLILFITFIVILCTLVLQGLSLPWLIRKLDLKDRFAVLSEEEQEKIILKKLSIASIRSLDEEFKLSTENNAYLKNLYARLELDHDFFRNDLSEDSENPNPGIRKEFQQVYLSLLEQQRLMLTKMNKRDEFDEELIRKYMGLIDIEEFKMREKLF